MRIRACPRCGNPVRSSCHHQGDDVSAVNMELSKAVSLYEIRVAILKRELEDCEETLSKMKLSPGQHTWPADDERKDGTPCQN